MQESVNITEKLNYSKKPTTDKIQQFYQSSNFINLEPSNSIFSLNESRTLQKFVNCACVSEIFKNFQSLICLENDTVNFHSFFT